ncbi:hypothetical protein N7931_15820 [Catenovulum sp. 2E275]|uniref:DUF7133 domain-containing protein n=1 Tax=Catenovulum sp. 2E275 TaxID=2980497 RepID=UPI0021CE9D9E|nr:hypothetical protein [Catenovulum sp. 2E275]MCU4677102.1 hypothetical protein [Catenovulum sp. 2E275]
MKKTLLAASLITALTPALAEQVIPLGYHLQTITTPAEMEFHVTGLDVDSDNNIYAATRFGDVWRYTATGQWLKFAEGLHEPTGLLVEDKQNIVIAQKPELTRLTDTDKDGVADDYIKLADGWKFHDNYHEYHFGPVKDKQGNFYGTLNLSHGDPNAFDMGTMGSSGGYRGWAYQVNTKGEFVPYAFGLRSPAGIGISPDNEVFFTDNQGDWVATSTLQLLQKDKFYGHPVSLIDHPDFSKDKIRNTSVEDYDKWRQKPVVHIPHVEIANSPGNPEWDTTKGKFGPFSGQIFVGDQTQSNVFRIILEEVDGVRQGAVINFIDGFQSGNIRIKFDHKGQLWVGQTARGWGAKGPKPYGLQKVVWDGTTPFEVLDIKAKPDGFRVSFTQPVNAESVNKKSITAEQWHYTYSANYGSPKVDLTKLEIKSIKQVDAKTLDLKLDATEDHVVMIDFAGVTNAKQQHPSSTKVYYTLNKKPE